MLFLFNESVFCGRNVLQYEIDDNFDVQKNDETKFQSHDEKLLHRDKRYLIFVNGGVAKVGFQAKQPINTLTSLPTFIIHFGFQIVLGFLTPVETRDRVNWRTLNLGYNFQAQYIPIPNATYLWHSFGRDLRHQRRMYDESGIHFQDMTRQLIYNAMEMFYDSRGKPGKQCLLKSICDAAEHPVVREGIFDEIIHLILT